MCAQNWIFSHKCYKSHLIICIFAAFYTERRGRRSLRFPLSHCLKRYGVSLALFSGGKDFTHYRRAAPFCSSRLLLFAYLLLFQCPHTRASRETHIVPLERVAQCATPTNFGICLMKMELINGIKLMKFQSARL